MSLGHLSFPARRLNSILVLLTLITLSWGCSPWPAPGNAAPASGLTEAQVVHVVDGDTIWVEIDNQESKVRYIGINTPEIAHQDQAAEWLGPEALAANRALVEGQTVLLEKDVSETDQHGRLLRYVWLGDTMVNETLVRQGYAWARRYPPDLKHADRLEAAQEQARRDGVGLWAETQDEYRCDQCIKGNINSQGEKIYHYPGCEAYDKTGINPEQDERWFSSETEAQAAGWRKAGNCP